MLIYNYSCQYIRGKAKSIIDWHKILVDLEERNIKYEPNIWYDAKTDFDNYQYEITINEKLGQDHPGGKEE